MKRCILLGIRMREGVQLRIETIPSKILAEIELAELNSQQELRADKRTPAPLIVDSVLKQAGFNQAYQWFTIKTICAHTELPFKNVVSILNRFVSDGLVERKRLNGGKNLYRYKQ